MAQAGSTARRAFALALALWLALPPSAAVATEAGRPTRAIVEAGRERDVLALVAPHAIGAEVAGGWRLSDVEVNPESLRFVLRAPSGARAALVLQHPARAGDEAVVAETRSFRAQLVGAGAPGATAALQTLLGAVRRNDDGGFWRTEALPETPLGAVLESSWFVGGAGRWLFDGLLLGALTLALLFALLGRQLRAVPAGARWALAGLFAAGALLRVVVPVETTFTAWPFQRLSVLAGAVFRGPLLASLSDAFDAQLRLVDVIVAITLVLSLLLPLVAFGTARTLRLGNRAALAAAGVAATLPLLLRFALSDAESVASVFLAGVCFVVLGTLLHDRSRAWRALALLALPPVVLATVVIRPLDLLHAPLLAFAALVLPARAARRWERAVAALLVLAVAGAAFALHVLPAHAGDLGGDDLAAKLELAAVSVGSSDYNTLLMPWITPPGAAFLALAGLVLLTVRRRAPAALVLVLWLVGFLAAHAVAQSHLPAMQARYHLHVALPFAVLAGAGLALLHRLVPVLALLLGVYLAATPAMHVDFIRARYNDQLEYAFVAEASAHVPPGCTVLEYVGPPERPYGARFARFGAVVDDGWPGALWDVRPLTAAAGPPDALSGPARSLLADPPDCLFVYQGLPCRHAPAKGTGGLAAACAAVHEVACLAPVDSALFSAGVYDPHLELGRPVRPGEPTVALWRVRPPGECRPAPPLH